MSRRIAVVIGTFALWAGGQQAEAATVKPLLPCYASFPNGGSQSLYFAIEGGRPLGRFQARAVGARVDDNPVDGSFDETGQTVVSLGDFKLGTEEALKSAKVKIAVTEFLPEGAQVTGTGELAVTNAALSVSTRGFTFFPFRKRRWRISGVAPLQGPGTYYASWVRNNYKSRRVVKRVRLGTPRGPCGYLTVKRMLPPVRRSGRWVLYIHVGKKLNKRFAVSRFLNVF